MATFGTLTINVLGCLLFGFVWSLADERMLISAQSRIVILTGFMGAFTTFSTFAFESVQLLRDGQFLAAAVNIVGQVLAGVAGLWVAFAISG